MEQRKDKWYHICCAWHWASTVTMEERKATHGCWWQLWLFFQSPSCQLTCAANWALDAFHPMPAALLLQPSFLCDEYRQGYSQEKVQICVFMNGFRLGFSIGSFEMYRNPPLKSMQVLSPLPQLVFKCEKEWNGCFRLGKPVCQHCFREPAKQIQAAGWAGGGFPVLVCKSPRTPLYVNSKMKIKMASGWMYVGKSQHGGSLPTHTTHIFYLHP